MEITFETVEKLHEITGASFADARAALEHSEGNLLDAVVNLERQGKSSTAGQGGFYTTQPGSHTEHDEPEQAEKNKQKGSNQALCQAGRLGGDRHTVHQVLSGLWHGVLNNQFEVWRRGEQVTSMPVLVLILLVVFFFWIAAPLLLIGLLFGCRYRFSGPELGREEVNRVMDRVSETVNDVRENVRRDLKHGFRGNRK
jgi:hypothetical protein